MGQEALYLKWRPQSFDDVIGQTHVTRTLRNACRSGRTAHAYLFAGPRGTGKTSIARILAKALNCQAEPEDRPCNECGPCLALNQGRYLDLIEIDGASNRGIDEMRDLREKVNFRPNEGGFKVYIIDEVHMLTREAFNALLKTLEEPPKHVVFVFATTEVWRVPATIRSRCQRFDFRPIGMDLLEARLAQICEAEGIAHDGTALPAIARQATGSVRDAISMLDQMASIGDGMVTADLVRSVLGTAPDEAAEELLNLLFANDVTGALELLGRLAGEGFDMQQFSRDLLDLSRAVLLAKLGVRPEVALPTETLTGLLRATEALSPEALMRVSRAFGEAGDQVRHGYLPQLPLELAVVELSGQLRGGSPAMGPAPAAPDSRTTPVSSPAPMPAGPPPARVPASPAPTAAPGPATRPAPEPFLRSSGQDQPPVTLDRARKMWAKVAAKVHRQDRTLEALLRSTEPVRLEGETLTVGFVYPFHLGCFAADPERGLLADAVAEVLGQRLALESTLIVPGGAPRPESPASEPTPKDDRQPPAAVRENLSDDPLYQAAAELGGTVRLVEDEGEEIE